MRYLLCKEWVFFLEKTFPEIRKSESMGAIFVAFKGTVRGGSRILEKEENFTMPFHLGG